jgi:hypothetical protein
MRVAMKRAWLCVLVLTACASSRGGVPTDAQSDGDGGDDAPDGGGGGGGDGFPAGAIAFFLDTQCPSGWSLYDDGVGRTVVPSSGDDAGTTVGEPLTTNEQRAHHHALQLDVDLSSVSYAGVAGEANHGVAQGGAVNGTTATDDSNALPPYSQLRICEKHAQPSADPPPGVIAFFAAAACPAAWTPAPAALQGRFLVALPSGGTPAATFGGAPLSSGEVRAHTHAATASLSASAHGIALASGCCAGGYGAAGAHGATATAGAAPVDLPYVQLLACVAPPAR